MDLTHIYALIYFIHSQRNHLIRKWTNICHFVCVNYDKKALLIPKIAEINRGKEGEILRPELMREHNCLMPDDFKEFADLLIGMDKIPNRMTINQALKDFKYMRLVRWHVMQSPEGVIPTEKSMSLLGLYVFF